MNDDHRPVAEPCDDRCADPEPAGGPDDPDCPPAALRREPDTPPPAEQSSPAVDCARDEADAVDAANGDDDGATDEALEVARLLRTVAETLLTLARLVKHL